MRSGVPDALAHIERGLITLERRTSLYLLRPGVTAERVRTTFAACGLPTRAEVEALYGWHDGSDAARASSLDDLHVFPGFYFLSLDDAVANYHAFVHDPRWTHGWFPLFANGGGDFYVLEAAGSDAGSVRHFRIEERQHPIEFASLEAMLRTLAEAFDQGVIYVDDHGYLEMDDQRFAVLAGQINPTVAWWNH